MTIIAALCATALLIPLCAFAGEGGLSLGIMFALLSWLVVGAVSGLML